MKKNKNLFYSSNRFFNGLIDFVRLNNRRERKIFGILLAVFRESRISSGRNS